jgi:hypothetical protein
VAQFSVNAQRFDPYKNFKFRVKWDGRYVAGVSKCSALKRTTEVVKHREGGDPSSSRKSPGRTEYEAITLERGVTHDTEFQAMPDLDANANAVAIQTLKLENEGWERDYEVVEPTEVSFAEPVT